MENNTVKLWPIVHNNHSWNFESTYDVFPDELGDIFVFDADIGFYLYPFAEIVGFNKQKLFLCYYNMQGPDYVHSPLCKRPRTCDRVESFSRYTRNESLSLTLITPFNMVFSILLHGEPVIPLRLRAMCQNSSI